VKKLLPMPSSLSSSYEAMNNLIEQMSNQLDTGGLNSEALSAIVRLLELGISSDAIAPTVKELRRQSQ
jgi:Mitotic-spindle organizing gamma-tubulin ring associated